MFSERPLPPRPPSEDPTPRTDQLAGAAQRGDAAAFSALYQRLLPALVTWARCRIPVAERVALPPEDLVQEIWCRAARSFDRFDPERASFRQWIFGVGRHALLHGLRGVTRRRAALPQDPAFVLDGIPDEVSTASTRIARSEDLQAIADWVEVATDAAERKLLVLRGFERRPLEEVGAALGCSAAAAQQRWARLQRRFVAVPGFGALLED